MREEIRPGDRMDSEWGGGWGGITEENSPNPERISNLAKACMNNWELTVYAKDFTSFNTAVR